MKKTSKAPASTRAKTPDRESIKAENKMPGGVSAVRAASPEAANASAEAPAMRRIGVHLSTAGGVFTAAERARAIGANTFQIFSSSPRMWRAATLEQAHCERIRELRALYDCAPLVIHTSYLVNVCSQSEVVRANSVAAFRGEVERALALGAEYLVLHPGSWRGLTRAEGLRLAAESIAQALDGLAWQACDFRVLIENTAGSEFSLGGSFEQVGELVERLRGVAPVGACLDTCHTHVAGYDMVSESGYEATVGEIGRLIGFDTVKVWHMNDAKAAIGSKLDRHEHIGEGTMGLGPFRRLLNDARFGHCAFIAETPVDEEGDELRNVAVLRGLAAGAVLAARAEAPSARRAKAGPSTRAARSR
jgi:deoxyribonuclease-4